MNKNILCVDDDPNILSGFKRSLRKDFEVYTAEGGEEALAIIKNEGEFAVIVSDMRMPLMDGVKFLSLARKLTPNTTRIMLTGNADQQTAVDAVNEGSIFRFLTKPCLPESLAKALTAGIEQYRLITAEKQLLEVTLHNSLQVMVEILSTVNPTAFSSSNRTRHLARNIALSLEMQKPWEVEIAAMLSQIGCVTVPEDTLQRISQCQPLEQKELKLYHQHPQVGHDLIARIPRMNAVAQIIANQNRRFNDNAATNHHTDEDDQIIMGAGILKAVLDFDKLIDMGNLPPQAYEKLVMRIGWYDQNILEALKTMIGQADEEHISVEVRIEDLKPGMQLDEPIYSDKNILILSKGLEVTLPFIMRLVNFARTKIIPETVRVSIPVSQFQAGNRQNNQTENLQNDSNPMPPPAFGPANLNHI